MTIIGIDTGVQHLGLAVYCPELTKFKHITEYNTKSYVDLEDYLHNLFTFYRVDIVVYEKPFFTPVTLAKNIRTLEVIGIIKLVAEKLQLPIHFLSPASIKKQITGSGRAKKEDIINSMSSRFNNEKYNWSKSTHIADAAAVAVSWHEINELNGMVNIKSKV